MTVMLQFKRTVAVQAVTKFIFKESLMNRLEIKNNSRQQIQGKIGTLFLITLIIAVISCAANAVPFVGFLAVLFVLTPAFGLSMARIYLGICAGKKPEVKDTFCGFDDVWSAFKVVFLVELFTTLWSLLFIIPGIVKSFSYSMSMYILAENKGMSAREAITRSKEMMNGHKLDLFVLYLSFFGWWLLCGITFGIAYIWVGPYMNAAVANFYNSIKGEYNPSVEAVANELPEGNNDTPAE